MKKVLVVFVILIGFVIMLGLFFTPSSPPPAASESTASQQARVAKKLERLAFIRNLQTEDLIGELECRESGGDMWVTPIFVLEEPFKSKQSIASVAYAYCFGDEEEHSVLTLRDSRSGRKRIGEFSPVSGGLKMD